MIASSQQEFTALAFKLILLVPTKIKTENFITVTKDKLFLTVYPDAATKSKYSLYCISSVKLMEQYTFLGSSKLIIKLAKD